MDIKQGLKMVAGVKNSLEQHWDRKLSKKFALAPVDLVRSKLVNADNYRKENHSFGVSSLKAMNGVLKKITADPGVRSLPEIHAQVVGAGLNRDLLWIPGWMDDRPPMSRYLTIRDISLVGCTNGRYWENMYFPNLSVRHEEAEESFDPGTPETQSTVLIYASQVIQIFDREKMQRVLRLWSATLPVPSHLPKHTRRICIVHPLPEDNTGPTTWAGQNFNGVKWGDTTPYSIDEMRTPIEEGLGGKANIEVLAKYKYYHQTYSLLEITSCEV